MQSSLLPYLLKFSPATRDLHPPPKDVFYPHLDVYEWIPEESDHVQAMWAILLAIRPSVQYEALCEVIPPEFDHDDPVKHADVGHFWYWDTNELELNEEVPRVTHHLEVCPWTGTLKVRCQNFTAWHCPPVRLIELNAEERALFLERRAQWEKEEDILEAVKSKRAVLEAIKAKAKGPPSKITPKIRDPSRW
ncbi:hypothetical protein K435DRAFT_798625 [Dendrothele bispora CBS 962.96]|uniref:Uncharacterized protein n=1 Tax=Dendrothele bispora (strain CBS 962.96) TaxID=1314807 RepID=A0A4S8LYH4_DENBC|nr:hypothetical protein K435DRAFT_798625 [Dendrothele bispora CBS 962.96]